MYCPLLPWRLFFFYFYSYVLKTRNESVHSVAVVSLDIKGFMEVKPLSTLPAHVLRTNMQDVWPSLRCQGSSVWCPVKSVGATFMHLDLGLYPQSIVRVEESVFTTGKNIFQNSCYHFYQSGSLHEHAEKLVFNVTLYCKCSQPTKYI